VALGLGRRQLVEDGPIMPRVTIFDERPTGRRHRAASPRNGGASESIRSLSAGHDGLVERLTDGGRLLGPVEDAIALTVAGSAARTHPSGTAGRAGHEHAELLPGGVEASTVSCTRAGGGAP